MRGGNVDGVPKKGKTPQAVPTASECVLHAEGGGPVTSPLLYFAKRSRSDATWTNAAVTSSAEWTGRYIPLCSSLL